MNIPKERIAGCGDASCEMLVSPIPRPKPRPIAIQIRPRKRRVAILDHGKPNSITILRRARELLHERGVEVGGEILQKPSSSTPMSNELLEQLAREEGLVLCGISDCGSCSAGSSIDAVLLQQRGVAGIPVLTAPFREVLGRVMTYYETDRPMPVIVIEHPTQNIDAAELEARARAIADAAEALLSASR